MLLLSPYIIKLNIAYSVAKGFPEFTCSMRLPTHWLPRSAINNSIRVETVWCPDGSSTINIIPDCEAHFSLQWCCMCVPPSNPPPPAVHLREPFLASVAFWWVIVGLWSAESSIYMSKPPQALDVRDPIWNDKAQPETADPQRRPG